MRQIVLDAGPLIALFYAKDTYHLEAAQGLEQLSQQKTLLLTPIPIVFEVYKWLLQRTYPEVAQQALGALRNSLHVVPFSGADFETLQTMVMQLSQWQGSLEDGTVMLTALRYQCPIWTYNFRDFSIFKSLDFWNPPPPR